MRGRALKKEEQEQVDIAQKVLELLKSGKDVRCADILAITSLMLLTNVTAHT